MVMSDDDDNNRNDNNNDNNNNNNDNYNNHLVEIKFMFGVMIIILIVRGMLNSTFLIFN